MLKIFLNSKDNRKGKTETKRRDKQKTNDNMVDLNPIKSIIMLSCNGLDTPMFRDYQNE